MSGHFSEHTVTYKENLGTSIGVKLNEINWNGPLLSDHSIEQLLPSC